MSITNIPYLVAAAESRQPSQITLALITALVERGFIVPPFFVTTGPDCDRLSGSQVADDASYWRTVEHESLEVERCYLGLDLQAALSTVQQYYDTDKVCWSGGKLDFRALGITESLWLPNDFDEPYFYHPRLISSPTATPLLVNVPTNDHYRHDAAIHWADAPTEEQPLEAWDFLTVDWYTATMTGIHYEVLAESALGACLREFWPALTGGNHLT